MKLAILSLIALLLIFGIVKSESLVKYTKFEFFPSTKVWSIVIKILLSLFLFLIIILIYDLATR